MSCQPLNAGAEATGLAGELETPQAAVNGTDEGVFGLKTREATACCLTAEGNRPALYFGTAPGSSCER